MQAQIHCQAPTSLIIGMCTALLMFSGVASAQFSKDDEKCANAMNKGLNKVAKALGGDYSACIKDGSKGKLTGTVEDCVTSDPKGKTAKQESKIKTDKCVGGSPPAALPGLVTDSAAVRAIIDAKEDSLYRVIFGGDIDVALVDGTVKANQDAAKCQQAIAKAVFKCQDAKLSSFNACKKDGIRGKTTPQITSAQILEDQCMNAPPNGDIPDVKGKIGKKCADFDIGKKCGGQDLNALLPGLDPNASAATIDAAIECEVCLALNAMDGLNRDCDEFDDGAANGSCAGCITTGQALAGLDGSDFCVAASFFDSGLIAGDLCLSSTCGGSPGCAVSLDFINVSPDLLGEVFDFTYDFSDSAMDLDVDIDIASIGTLEFACTLNVSNADVDVGVTFTTSSVAPGIVQIDSIDSVSGTATASFALSGCGGLPVSAAAVIAEVEPIVIAELESEAETRVNLLMTSLIGQALCLPPCPGGVTVGDACWYLGGLGESCDTVCGNVGQTYDTATETYAGSGGTIGQCYAVLDALGETTPPNIDGGDLDCSLFSGLGCHVDNGGFRGRCAIPATTAAAADPDTSRACACDF